MYKLDPNFDSYIISMHKRFQNEESMQAARRKKILGSVNSIGQSIFGVQETWKEFHDGWELFDRGNPISRVFEQGRFRP